MVQHGTFHDLYHPPSRTTEEFSQQLQDKICEWPGNEANKVVQHGMHNVPTPVKGMSIDWPVINSR